MKDMIDVYAYHEILHKQQSLREEKEKEYKERP